MRVPFLSRDQARMTSIVFDIGSGSAAAAVVVAYPNAPTRVLLSNRVTLSNEDRSENQLMTALAHATSEAGDSVLKSYAASPLFHDHGPVKQVFTTVHAPWVASHTRDSHITLSAPTHITRELLEKAGKEAAQGAEAIPSGKELFEQTIVRVELNGYPTGAPIGKIAGEIRVLALKSYISSEFKALLIHALGTLLPGRTPTFHSSMFTYSSVVRELAYAPSYTFLDIASEASACSVVHNGAIAQQATIPAGIRSLIRSATAAGTHTPEALLSMIRMISEGTCSDVACEEVAQALTGAEPVFMRAFGEVFSTLITESRLPNTLFLSVHPTIAPWAHAFFERIDFSQFTLTGKPFSVQVLSTRALTDLAVFGAESTVDTGIAVLAALVHIRHART